MILEENIIESSINNCESESTPNVPFMENATEEEDIYIVEVLMANHLKPIIMYIYDFLMGFLVILS